MRRTERMLRATVASCLSTAVAAAMHAAAGASAPHAASVAISLAIAFFVCVHLAGRALSRLRLAAAVALSQGVYHWMFAAGSGSGHVVTHETVGAHTHGALTVVVTEPTFGHGAHGAGMIAAHAFAAAATYLVLRKADVMLAFATRLIASVFSRLRSPAPMLAPAAPARVSMPAIRATRGRIVAASCGLRGPPLHLA